MISDNSAIDTIFGALVLILSCFACSGIILTVSDWSGPGSPMEIREMEERFDTCLLSTIPVDRKVMNTIVRENVQLVDYLSLRFHLVSSGLNSSPDVLEEGRIFELFEFYFEWSDYWRLELILGNGATISIAESGNSSPGSNLAVLEKAIQISNGSSCVISFSVEL